MENKLIPTDNRDKIPRHLSYPLGAQEISCALIDVPQYDDLTLSFHDSPTILKFDFHNAIKNGFEYAILRVRYSHTPLSLSACHDFEEMGFYNERWSLSVYPVLQEKRHVVHELLCAEGLASVCEWLSTHRPDTWRTGQHCLTVTFDGSNEVIRFRE